MSEPLRILHCVVNMNRGGAETLIMNIYRNIDRSKVQFDFLTSAEGVFDNEIKQLGGKVYRHPYITKVGPFRYSKSIYSFFKEHPEYDIVHSHMDRMSGLIMREAKRAGVSVRIAHSHNTRSEGGSLIRIVKKYYSMYLKNATNYFACSKAAAEFMFPHKKVNILNNGIETQRFIFNKKIREKLQEQYNCKNNFVIGHVARFNKQKNHEFLIDIFSEIHKKCSNAILILVGKGKLQKHIKEKVEQLGLNQSVKFLGSCNNVNELLNLFDIFLFPSLFEGLPVTVIEAQASGLKCVLSDSITKDVDISGNVEFVSLKKNASEWANVVLKYKDGYKRENMSENIGKNKYDIKETAKWLEGFYLNECSKQT